MQRVQSKTIDKDQALTLCILWTLPLLYVGRVQMSFSGCWVHSSSFILHLMEILLANKVDADQAPHYMASVLGLHCLPMTLVEVS